MPRCGRVPPEAVPALAGGRDPRRPRSRRRPGAVPRPPVGRGAQRLLHAGERDENRSGPAGRHPDAAAVRRGDRVHDRQAEPGAARGVRAEEVAADELLEQARLQVGGMLYLSVTLSMTLLRPGRARSATVTVVPGGVCPPASPIRSASTCRSRRSSPRTMTGSSGSSSGQLWPGRPRGRRWRRPWPAGSGPRPSPAARHVQLGQQQKLVDEHAHPRRLRFDPAERGAMSSGTGPGWRRASSA